jgi:hypothetical protein
MVRGSNPGGGGAKFSVPVQTGPGAHPVSCTMGTGSFPGIKCGRGVLLTIHPLLEPTSWKIRATPLPTLGHNRACNGVTLPYYCHWVSTQLQLTSISYHIISYHHIIYHIISYIISYHLSYHIMYDIIYIISYHIVSYHIVSYHIIYHIISYIISYHISYHHSIYHIISYIISYKIYHIISCIISYISYHISYHIVSYHIIPYIISYIIS